MTRGQEQVKAFMLTFDQECPEKPIQLDEKTAILRAKLILEEAFETITKGLGLEIAMTGDNWAGDAVFIDEYNLKEGLDFEFIKIKEVDLVELCDGLADLAYVGEFGTAVAAGIDLEPIQEEVHASNMSKLWKENELHLMPPDTIKVPKDNGLFVVKDQSGKAIKSPSYTPARIRELIEKQMNL